jgi:hypothetical protein
MEAESESLKVQIDHLKSGIAVERDHSAVLAERAGRRGGVAEQEQTLEALAHKVSGPIAPPHQADCHPH